MKARFTVHVRSRLVERARNAVYWTPGLTLAELVERGLELALRNEEERRGSPFADRDGTLRTGRPVR